MPRKLANPEKSPICWRFIVPHIFFVFLCFSSQAQKNVHILDVFYEALSKDSSDVLEYHLDGGDFILDDYLIQKVNPETIMNRHPDARKYLVDDSLFIINCTLRLTGKVLDRDTYDPSIEFKNIHFNYFQPNLIVYAPSAPDEIFYGSRLIFSGVKASHIRSTSSCNFRFDVSNSVIGQFEVALINPPTVEIVNSVVDHLLVAHMNTDHLLINNCRIEEFLIVNVEMNRLEIFNNTFVPPSNNDFPTRNDSSTFGRSVVLGNEPYSIVSNNSKIDIFILKDNHFKTNFNEPVTLIGVSGSIANITGNFFDGNVILATKTHSEFELNNNDFSTISLMASLPQTPQNYVSINWQDLKGRIVWKRNSSEPSYYGTNELELEDVSNFNKLISSYRKLVEVYKNNGNTTDANNAYLEMKKLQEKRYDHINRIEGGADNYFRLKLHQLLSAYTRHGTDPAQAIGASIWLIFLFSIVYFFFPSDWDDKSKTQLISDYRTFKQKNDHGYFFPFLKVIWGIVVSLFNAFTLSVNSFVTLGFGVIPTKGLAKYVCILEGFLGWFLLSIFVVSLINQVLF